METVDIEAGIKGLLGLNLRPEAPAAAGQTASQAPSDLAAAPRQGRVEARQGQAPGSYPSKRKNKAPSSNGQNATKDEAEERTQEGSRPSDCEGEELLLAAATKEAKAGKPENFTVPDNVIQFLDAKYIRPLKKKSLKFTRAQWFCHLCEYHCDNLTKCHEHYTDTRHSRLIRLKGMDFTLSNLPKPSKLHCDSLNSVLINNANKVGISKEELIQRSQVADSVENILKTGLKDCKVRLYGSSLTGLGLRTSNINLDLVAGPDLPQHLVLIQSLKLLRERGTDFKNVEDDFNSQLPAIRFETQQGQQVELSLNNVQAHNTSLLLREYVDLDPRVKILGVNLRHWASITRLDKQAFGTLPPHAINILTVYALQQLEQPVVPCIHDFMKENEEGGNRIDKEELSLWKTKNTESVSELWIKMFEFYSLTFERSKLVVSIRKSEIMTNEEKDWKSKKLAIEDPYSTKRNLCRSIQHYSVFSYITEAFKTGYLYFGTIQTRHGPVITKIIPSEDTTEGVNEGLGDWTLESWLSAKGTVLTVNQTLTAVRLVPKNMVSFEFSEANLTFGSEPQVVCAVCTDTGHTTSSCPEEQLPPLTPLPKLRPDYIQMLNSLCVGVTRKCEPTAMELNNRDHIMRDLDGYIKRIFRGAELTLFGSSSNGFAFRHSDLDVSLTFIDQATPENLDCIGIIEELAEKIRRMSGVSNVQAITSAKVPIIKLYYQHLNVEADISLYNVLARENTKLLSLYSELDERVKILGYMVKHFAKICDIGDASRGSLSSYAYILMMIFFLQQTSPPVIPVLQEMHDGEKPEHIVDGWNAWFQSDPNVISRWRSENKASVGQLWILFLHFYAGDWDDAKLVVSIRQKAPLTKFEKMWNSPCFAIEDPFELSHNLSRRISRRMNIYIKKAFINGRRVFLQPRSSFHNSSSVPRGYRSFEEYFFDHRQLTDGAPPNDRGCRACGKIGHLVADCPRKKASDVRKQKNKEQQERNRTKSEQFGENERNEGKHNERERQRTRSEIPASSNSKDTTNRPNKKNASKSTARGGGSTGEHSSKKESSLSVATGSTQQEIAEQSKSAKAARRKQARQEKKQQAKLSIKERWLARKSAAVAARLAAESGSVAVEVAAAQPQKPPCESSVKGLTEVEDTGGFNYNTVRPVQAPLLDYFSPDLDTTR